MLFQILYHSQIENCASTFELSAGQRRLKTITLDTRLSTKIDTKHINSQHLRNQIQMQIIHIEVAYFKQKRLLQPLLVSRTLELVALNSL